MLLALMSFGHLSSAPKKIEASAEVLVAASVSAQALIPLLFKCNERLNEEIAQTLLSNENKHRALCKLMRKLLEQLRPLTLSVDQEAVCERAVDLLEREGLAQQAVEVANDVQAGIAFTKARMKEIERLEPMGDEISPASLRVMEVFRASQKKLIEDECRYSIYLPVDGERPRRDYRFESDLEWSAGRGGAHAGTFLICGNFLKCFKFAVLPDDFSDPKPLFCSRECFYAGVAAKEFGPGSRRRLEHTDLEKFIMSGEVPLNNFLGLGEPAGGSGAGQAEGDSD